MELKIPPVSVSAAVAEASKRSREGVRGGGRGRERGQNRRGRGVIKNAAGTSTARPARPNPLGANRTSASPTHVCQASGKGGGEGGRALL